MITKIFKILVEKMDDRKYFKATLSWTWQEYEWYIDKNCVFIDNELIWFLEKDDFISIKEQLISILNINHYDFDEFIEEEPL